MKRLSKGIIFQSDHLSQDLSRKSVRGGMASMAGQGIRFALGLAGVMVLARLLTPDDFGLIGMVLVITGFADMFKNAGLSTATITIERVSHEQISTLFWLNVLLSAVLGGCPGWLPRFRFFPPLPRGFFGLTMSLDGGLEEVAEFLRAAANSCSN